jgi:pyruvate/2-oxoglutarate dehydrogenase complex dihydrolipoamide dehydrogenase (E3) component
VVSLLIKINSCKRFQPNKYSWLLCGGDVTLGQTLAHVASAEGINCVEKIAGLQIEPLDYGNIPGCTYASQKLLQ